MRRPESVLVVVYSVSGQILLLQRADDPDFWQSVTGSLESGEVPGQAAIRELAEETGIKSDSIVDCHTSSQFKIREDWLFRYPSGTTHNTEHVFTAEVPDGTVIRLNPAEHLAFEWVSPVIANHRLWSETNRQALNYFVPFR